MIVLPVYQGQSSSFLSDLYTFSPQNADAGTNASNSSTLTDLYILLTKVLTCFTRSSYTYQDHATVSVSILLTTTNIFLQFDAISNLRCYLEEPSLSCSTFILNPDWNSFFQAETMRIAKFAKSTWFTMKEAYF